MKLMKIRFPVAVSGTAWSVSGWSNNSGRQSKDYEDGLTIALRACVFDAVGSDPNVMVVHWIEVEVPITESETIQGKVTS